MVLCKCQVFEFDTYIKFMKVKRPWRFTASSHILNHLEAVGWTLKYDSDFYTAIHCLVRFQYAGG